MTFFQKVAGVKNVQSFKINSAIKNLARYLHIFTQSQLFLTKA